MRRLVLLLAGVLTLAACGSADGGRGPDIEGPWQLRSGTVDGVALPQPSGARATLDLTGDEARGTSFCNHWFATYRLNGSAISFDGLGGTEMGCAPDVMAAESAYLAALGAVDGVTVDGEELVLTGDGVELRFGPVPAVPTRALVGTTWTLETVLAGDLASSTVGEPATLRLAEDGTLAGSTGCRALTGTWETRGDEVLTPDLRAEGECPDDVRAQDDQVLAVLGDGFRAQIDGDRLTARDADGRGLVYRAAMDTDGLLGSWELVAGDAEQGPVPLPEGARATLTFSPGSHAGGTSFCNSYGGAYTVEGDVLRLEDVAVTLMACEGPIGSAEAAYLDALLDRDHRVELAGDRLVLGSDAGTLTFDRLPPVPVEELTDRRWVLAAVEHGAGPVPPTGPAFLELRSDGSATVSTGCREFEARWQAAGDTVRLSDWEFQLLDCPAEVAGQDEAVVQVLAGAFRPQVDGDVLTVGGVDTRGAQTPTLVYRP